MPRGKKKVDTEVVAEAGTTDQEIEVVVESEEPVAVKETEVTVGEANVATVKGNDSRDELIAALKEQNDRLLSLFAANQMVPREEKPEDDVVIRNSVGAALGIEVTDVTGRPRIISLQARNEFARVSRKQLDEAREKYPVFFTNGWLSVDGEDSDNPNLITDLKAFVDEISFDDIKERINAITSRTTLTDLFNFLETNRYELEGETVGEDKELILRERDDLDPRLITLSRAVQRRLFDLTGIRVSLDG